MENNSNNKRNNTLLFLSGIIVGGATAYYLNTPNGKKFRKNVVDKSSEISDNIVSTTKELSNTLKEKADSTLKAATELTNHLTEKATQSKEAFTSSVQETAVNKLDDFEKGIKKAKSKIKNNLATAK